MGKKRKASSSTSELNNKVQQAGNILAETDTETNTKKLKKKKSKKESKLENYTGGSESTLDTGSLADEEKDIDTNTNRKKRTRSNNKANDAPPEIIADDNETISVNKLKKGKKIKTNKKPVVDAAQESIAENSVNEDESVAAPHEVVVESAKSTKKKKSGVAPLGVVVESAKSTKKKKPKSEQAPEDGEDIKDEDIDQFCDELTEEDNVQFDNWVKLIEAKLHLPKNKQK